MCQLKWLHFQNTKEERCPMGPFYKTKRAASTTCAARRIGTFAGENPAANNFSVEKFVNGKSFNLLNAAKNQGVMPDSAIN